MPRVSKLLDHTGAPIIIADLKRDMAAPSIGSVRSPFSGDPSGGLTPDRLAVILRQAEQGDPLAYFELAERIEEKDLHYAGVLGTRKRSVTQIDVSVEAASEDKTHQTQAETIRAWLRRDELQDELFDVLDAIGKGVSFTEIIWDASEGQFQPSRLEWRDPRFFTFDTGDGATPLLLTAGGRQPLPGYKFIQARFRAKSGLPIRGGLTRIACWAWMFKAFTQRDWAIFTQTFGQPIRLGRYHQGALEEEKEKLYQAVVNIASDCAAIMPETMKIEFVEAKSLGTSTEHYERRANWLDQQMSKAVLGQTTTTDAISGGHAVAREHRLVQEDIERADAKALAALLNRDLVRPFIDLNFGPQALYPRLVIARPEARDVGAIMGAIEKAVPMGLQVPKSFIHDLLGIPDAAPGEAVLEAGRAASQPPPQPGGGAGEEGSEEDVPSLNAGMGNGQDEVDRLAAAAEALARPGSTAYVEVLRGLVDEALTLEEVRDRLLALRPGMPEAQMAEAMRQALAYAELAGADSLETGA